MCLVVRRGVDLVECCPFPAHFFADLFGRFVLDEWFRVVVPMFGPSLDRFDQRVDRAERVAAQPTLGDLLEPPFDEVGPRRARRREVEAPPGALGIDPATTTDLLVRDTLARPQQSLCLRNRAMRKRGRPRRHFKRRSLLGSYGQRRSEHHWPDATLAHQTISATDH